MKKTTLALALAALLALPVSASAAYLDIAPEDLPEQGLTATPRERGLAVDYAASTRGPATLTLRCETPARVSVDILGGDADPKTRICDKTKREVAFLFFPGLSGVRVTLVSVRKGGSETLVHAILRETGGAVDHARTTLRLR